MENRINRCWPVLIDEGLMYWGHTLLTQSLNMIYIIYLWLDLLAVLQLTICLTRKLP